MEIHGTVQQVHLAQASGDFTLVPSPPRPWDSLPPDLQANIFSRLVETLVCASVRSQKQWQRRIYLNLSLVCKKWLALSRQSVQTLTFTNPHSRLRGRGLWLFPNLTTINLHGLPLTSLNDELAEAVTRHCPSLQRLNMGFPERSVMDQDDWEALVSRLNSLTRFQVATPEGDSAPLSSILRLSSLCLEHRAPPTFELNLFPDWTAELRSLDLRFRTLVPGIPPCLFSPHSSLTEVAIRVADSRIRLDLPGTFFSLPRLEKLSLIAAHLPLSMIERLTVFTGMSELSLRCKEPYSALPSGVFSGLTKLRRLTLGLRELRHLPEDLGQLSQLEELEVSCVAGKLPDSVGRLGRLKRLTLKYMPELICLPSTVVGLRRLQFLCISRCEGFREVLPIGVGDMLQLQEVVVDKRLRRCVPRHLESKVHT